MNSSSNKSFIFPVALNIDPNNNKVLSMTIDGNVSSSCMILNNDDTNNTSLMIDNCSNYSNIDYNINNMSSLRDNELKFINLKINDAPKCAVISSVNNNTNYNLIDNSCPEPFTNVKKQFKKSK
jgi:hypothetical protein